MNKEDFKPYFGEQGWRNFVTLNMLKPFVDDAYIPVIRSKGYTNRERFFEEANRYIDFTTEFINQRAIAIVQYLKV